jgi:hypothetical protein
MIRETSSFSPMRHDHGKRRQEDVNFLSMLIDAMKASMRHGITTGYVIAIVRKLLARTEPGRLADNLIAFDHKLAAVSVRNDPLATKESHGAVRSILDRDEVDERVRFICRQRRPSVMVGKFIKAGG